MTTILVTGATGTVGTTLVKRLLAAGATVRAAARSAESAGALAEAGAEPVRFDFDDADAMARAVSGVERAFLLVPNVRDPVSATARFVGAAAAAGVRHVVKLSALDCDVEPTIAFGRAHRAGEQVLERSGLAWTSLRPNNFMDNFLPGRHGSFAPDANGEILLPWGDAACSFLAAEDIGAVAAAVLTTTGHEGKVYDLTGPSALTLAEAADVLARTSGRPVRYRDAPPAAVRERMLAQHVPPPVVEAMLELHALGKSGRAARVTRTVEELTKTPARSLAAFARENAAALGA